MTAKEYLSQLTNIHLRIEAMERVVEECYSRATKVTTGFSDVPSGTPNGNSTEEWFLRYTEKKESLKALCDELEMFAYKITREINTMSNNTYTALLINKYVCNRTWEQVAGDLGMNMDYVKGELHSKALTAFEREVMNTSQNLLVFPR